ncbi:unnamed protein product, partial [Amoebophrya sp. A25]|eukprot:GSA25T00020124001.1
MGSLLKTTMPEKSVTLPEDVEAQDFDTAYGGTKILKLATTTLSTVMAGITQLRFEGRARGRGTTEQDGSDKVRQQKQDLDESAPAPNSSWCVEGQGGDHKVEGFSTDHHCANLLAAAARRNDVVSGEAIAKKDVAEDEVVERRDDHHVDSIGSGASTTKGKILPQVQLWQDQADNRVGQKEFSILYSGLPISEAAKPRNWDALRVRPRTRRAGKRYDRNSLNNNDNKVRRRDDHEGAIAKADNTDDANIRFDLVVDVQG